MDEEMKSKYDNLRGHVASRSHVHEVGKVTLYLKSEFLGGFNKVECTSAQIAIGKYAQYEAAIEVLFVPKGKRNVRGTVQGYEPSLIVLEGWDHPDPDDGMVKVDEMSSRSKYLSHDEGWQKDLSAMIDAHVAKTGAKVLADFRGHNSYTRFNDFQKSVAA